MAEQSVDASIHLEEIFGDNAFMPGYAHGALGVTRLVELIGPHLRLRGRVSLGYHRRLTDVMNSTEGMFRISDAIVLRRNGDPTRVQVPDLWVAPNEVTLIADLEAADAPAPPRDLQIPKEPVGLIVVTPGHTINGLVYTPPGAQLSVFVESPTPPFIPMTELHTRSLADRRVRAHYEFAVLNRRHIVAASPMPEHLQDVRRGL
ncbi:MAG: hypothetical protein U0838_09360 [Chloroflexota bacterium]